MSASECRLAELMMDPAASCRAYTVLLLTAASCHSACMCIILVHHQVFTHRTEEDSACMVGMGTKLLEAVARHIMRRKFAKDCTSLEKHHDGPHLVRELRSDAREDVLGNSLGLHVGVADAGGQLAQGHQPHVHGQPLGQVLHHVDNLAPC